MKRKSGAPPRWLPEGSRYMKKRRLEFEGAEAEGVGDYGDGAEAHGGAGDHGAEEPAEDGIKNSGGDGDSKSVVEKSEQ
jgi:hypothetical protein